MIRMPWLALGVLIAWAGAAHATCPESVADCLGAAAGFSIVAEKLTIDKGITGSEGYFGPRPARVEDACAATALVGGPVDCETTVRNLILLAPDGVAAIFASTPSYCSAFFHPGIGVIVSGDVVTGGGLVRNPAAASILGVVDTSGTDPRLATCAQAISDMQSASTMLAALSPTRDLGDIHLRPTTARS